MSSGFRRYKTSPSNPNVSNVETTAIAEAKGTPVFDDSLPVELLELVRKFRRTVEGAIMGAETLHPFPSQNEKGLTPAPFQISPFAGAELSHSCTDLVRYIAQLLKQKKDEFDELFIRHRHWKKAPHTAPEETRAREVGPMVLTSLYGMVESLLTVTGADRGILYVHNPQREELVGIVYGGASGENVMDVPITVKASRADVLLALANSASTGATLSGCGVPTRSPIDPVVLAYSLDVGINIGDMESAKSVEEIRGQNGKVSAVRFRGGLNRGRADVSVEPYGPMAGYTVHNMLCVPLSLPVSMWSHGKADGQAKADTIGVLQLFNKLKHSPSVKSESQGIAPQFTAADESLAHHASLSMGSLLRWGVRGTQPHIDDLDFLSLESRHLSVELQRLSHAERVRCRDQDGAAVFQLGPAPLGGGSRSLTHTESNTLKAQQSASTLRNGNAHRGHVVGELLDKVTCEVAANHVHVRQLPRKPSTPRNSEKPMDAITLTNTIFAASPLPRRQGPLLIHRVAHTEDNGAMEGPSSSGVVVGVGDVCAHVVGASQAVSHLRDAWTHAHHTGRSLEKRVKSLESSLASEQQHRRKLEAYIRQAGLSLPASLAQTDMDAPTVSSDLDFLKARIINQQTSKR